MSTGPDSGRGTALVNRLITNVPYRIATVVMNNPADAIANYRASYAATGPVTPAMVISKLTDLWEQGYHQAVERILAITWVRGKNEQLDAAYDQAMEEVDADQEGPGQAALADAPMPQKMAFAALLPGLFSAIGAVGNIGAGARAERAAAADQETIRVQAAAQAQADAAKQARQTQLLKWGGIALGALAAIALLIYLIRRQ